MRLSGRERARWNAAAMMMIHACNGSGVSNGRLLSSPSHSHPQTRHLRLSILFIARWRNCENRRRPRLLPEAAAETDTVARTTPFPKLVACLKRIFLKKRLLPN